MGQSGFQAANRWLKLTLILSTLILPFILFNSRDIHLITTETKDFVSVNSISKPLRKFPNSHFTREENFHVVFSTSTKELESQNAKKISEYTRIWCIDCKQFEPESERTKKKKKKQKDSKISSHNVKKHKNEKDFFFPPRQPSSNAYTGEIGRKNPHIDSHGCTSASVWQDYVPTTCNLVHEIDMSFGVRKGSSKGVLSKADPNSFSHVGNESQYISSTLDHTSVDNDSPGMKILAHGDQRQAWLMEGSDLDLRPWKMILKTLRYDRSVKSASMKHQLKDALASERMSSSPNVVDIYGFCSLTAINEFADGGDLYYHMETTNKGNTTSLELLMIARDTALALADLHEVDGPDSTTTLVHHDVRRPNFLVINGRVKAHDFNQAQFLSVYQKSKNVTIPCGFSWANLCEGKRIKVYPRAPEECIFAGKKVAFSEKVETYRLGSFFFHILTGVHPYEKFEPEGPDRPLEEALQWVIDKKRIPKFPKEIDESNDPSIKALSHAIRMAMTQDYEKRPKTRKVADYLVRATKKVLSSMDASN